MSGNNEKNKFELIQFLYVKEEIYGFNIAIDGGILIVSLFSAVILFNTFKNAFVPIAVMVASLSIIIGLRYVRMNLPRGYLKHLLYHHGLLQMRGMPPGGKICDKFHE